MVIMIERRNCYGKNTELLSKALRLLPEVKNTVVHPNEGQGYSKPLGKVTQFELISEDILLVILN